MAGSDRDRVYSILLFVNGSWKKMVKCPRGTLAQIKANERYFSQPPPNSSSGISLEVGESETENLAVESEGSELDSVRADKRSPPTAREELIYFFTGYFLDILIESWQSKPCKKPKLGSGIIETNQGEFYGEDLGPCEESSASSTMDLLKDLSQKRLSQMSKETIKKDSESSESEYLNEVDLEMPECVDPLHKFVPDEQVHFKFYNGVWYKGRVSRRLMEGSGTYFWEDGASYQGEFVGGCVTGKGRMEFSSQTVYEGDVYRAYRHGEGTCWFVDSPVMYSGQWWLGKKHGYGLIVYNDSVEPHNFYRGQWQDGFKEGFGFRQYSSGAKYVGFWSNGKRHGNGVMMWSNHDIYRGQWKEGVMHGYGEYTWKGFVNKTLSYPATNTYRGLWSEGKRNGLGVLECKSGALIETCWTDNVKCGPGTVICCNGAIIASNNLFEKDKQACFCDQVDNLGQMVKQPKTVEQLKGKSEDEYFVAYLGSVERAKAISIPILSPPQTLNLDIHTQKYAFQKYQELKSKEIDPCSSFDVIMLGSESNESFWECYNGKEGSTFDSRKAEMSKKDSFCPNQLKECASIEGKQLRHYIIRKSCELRAYYDHYATLACEKRPHFKCVLLRLFLWQMLIECGVPSSNLSLVDIDLLVAQEPCVLIASPHDPFERICFWQFIQILILLSWHMYGQYVLGERPPFGSEGICEFLEYYEKTDSKVVLKTAFEYFLRNHVFMDRFCAKPFSRTERPFEETDLAPMEAMYYIYTRIGVPHSARDFLNAVCAKTDDNTPHIVRYFEKLPYYKMEGQNALMVAGELHYVPSSEPFNYPQLHPLERVNSEPIQFNCLNGLKPSDVLKCLIQVCPEIVSDGVVVNMDYLLTFLEFYRVIILCTERQLKLKKMREIRGDVIKQYKIQLEEYEKRMENDKRTEVAQKNSRPRVDASKKGRKNTNNE